MSEKLRMSENQLRLNKICHFLWQKNIQVTPRLHQERAVLEVRGTNSLCLAQLLATKGLSYHEADFIFVS